MKILTTAILILFFIATPVFADSTFGVIPNNTGDKALGEPQGKNGQSFTMPDGEGFVSQVTLRFRVYDFGGTPAEDVYVRIYEESGDIPIGDFLQSATFNEIDVVTDVNVIIPFPSPVELVSGKKYVMQLEAPTSSCVPALDCGLYIQRGGNVYSGGQFFSGNTNTSPSLDMGFEMQTLFSPSISSTTVQTMVLGTLTTYGLGALGILGVLSALLVALLLFVWGWRRVKRIPA